ncbi:uncharacterized protein F4807DRAFT_460975 [Annulohypoxylon truncatum]|uniref:uncharacterized protein n=1 Tax=Annulohypoxylon truncatum TaxID=327061 RepID=UPI002008E5EB|nr:uncharacterized protein F4807DRAFT_460975 [Annulohypoxylon truncatum]KAI1209283.1 hypothetical protein F4807DRAFT_460975 [Annulohypoxylon truncatum]
MSAAALALPQPLPAAVDDASSAILGGLNSGLNGVLGSPDQRYEDGEGGHEPGCHYRHREDIARCINACVAQCAPLNTAVKATTTARSIIITTNPLAGSTIRPLKTGIWNELLILLSDLYEYSNSPQLWELSAL